MNENKHIEGDAALSGILRDWQVNAALPPRFQEQVWQRIAGRETRPGPTPWALLMSWVEQTLARPALAVGYVTVLLLAGLAAGYWQARLESTRTSAALSSRYVQMIDPYLAAHR